VALANVLMAVVLWFFAGELDAWIGMPWFDRAIRLAGCVLAGLIVYLTTLWLSGLRPRHLGMRPELSGR
jgi:peptidoglycan biosynthesis protein MviN/MurJ (putative lipid II flippase)